MGTEKNSFLSKVTEQIKAKEAKKVVSEELSYHLMEAKKRWMEKGLTESEAEEKAVGQMGSPVKLGQQLNKLHKPKVDWLLLTLFITTLILGFLPILSLGYMSERHFSLYKTVFVLLGAVVAIGIMLFDYRKLKTKGWLFYTIGMLLLIVLRFFPNTMINGVPMVRIPPITIESLMSLPFFYLAWATFFNNPRLKIWQLGILFFPSLVLFLSIPSMTTTYLYIVMVFVMLWWSHLSRKTILTITAITVITFLITGFTFWRVLKTYQLVRVLAFLNPEKYSEGPGFMYLRVKDLMSHAGWFGSSAGKKEFIPEAHTNFVFVSFTHYYGWLFAICLVLILSLFVARIIVVAPMIGDSYGKLFLIGAVALYTAQLASNILMTLGLFPMTAMPLPFISYGLMPILLNSVLIGMVLSVYRRKDLHSRTSFN